MDTIFNLIAARLGIDPLTLALFIPLIVAICNLAGKLIPDDATGFLGGVRKVCKVLGVYVSNRVAVVNGQAITNNDATRAIAGATSITAKDSKGKFKSVSLRSPWFVVLLAGIATLLLAGCSSQQQARTESTVAAICSSAPLAQAAYNLAVSSGDSNRVNQVLNTIQATCPAVLILIETVPVKAAPAVGERG